MPRRRSEPQAVVIPSTALVASATRYPGRAARIYQPKQDWQTECYRQYAICGEARFAAKFFGNAVSRAVLNAAEMKDGVPFVQTTGPANQALVDLFDGKDGPTQMLEAVGQHLTIAGECYLVGRAVDGGDVWEIVSCIEMRVAGDKWQIDYGNGTPPVDLTEDDVVIRIWLPNPARRIEADSPFKALLPILTEIEWLTRHVFAQVTSRLAGAGILMLPQGMSFPPAPAQDGQEVQATNDADAFMLTLAEAMMQPIKDPGSPSAIVPIVVTAPDDTIDKAKLLTFWSELDANSMALRNEAIRRFALGMDLPPEQVLGMSSNGGTGGGNSNGVSHWGAWQIEESTIKMHIEPMLDVIVNALTMGYLRPILGDTSTAVVVYDTSRLRLRPDRSKEAFELYDRGLISAEALRRENGFDKDDAPTENEFHMWLLVKVASGSTTPEQVNAALLALGVPLASPPSGGAPSQAPPSPSLEDHPTRPRTPAESALVAASEALVFRALERAGNRLRQTGSRPPGVPSYETHLYVKANGSADHLLDDAWSCAPKVLAGIADPERVIPILDSYCQTLLTEQSPHERDRMAHWLELSGEVA
jgi:hypothetical protein